MARIDPADTAWLLISAALVMFMTPGLAFFYGGLVRAKNVLTIMMQSFAALAVVTLLWVLVGYSLAFGPDRWHVIGSLTFAGLRGVGAAPHPAAPTVPATAFMAFQLMFAVITPALVTGAFADRMRFPAYLLFVSLWSVLVYPPVAHWVWGGGFLGSAGLGALDFAGGTVVHVNAGAAALAAVIVIGKRSGHPSDAFVPHNVPLVLLGAGMLWFGWFGFNAGSALSSGALASSAFVATHLGAAGAVFGWLIPEWHRHGKATTVGAATGAVAGLVAITPASGYVGPWAALLIGFTAGFVCFWAVALKGRLRVDDALDVVGVHLVGGMVGALLTGIFASIAVNPAGAAASLVQTGRQAVAVLVTLGFSFGGSLVLLRVIDRLAGLRAAEEDQERGLDLAFHGEAAYTFGERSATPVLPAHPVGDSLSDEVVREAIRVLEAAVRTRRE